MNTLSKMSNLSLRTRLIIVFMTILLSLAAINCVQIYLFVGYVRQYNAMMETITLTNSINGVLKQQLDDEMLDIVYGKVPFEKGKQYDLLSTMKQNLVRIEADDSQGHFTDEITDVRKTLNTATEYINKLGNQILNNTPSDQRKITYEYITITTDIVDDQVQQLLQTTLKVSEQSKNEIVKSLKRDITIYIVAFSAVILLSFLFAWYISGSIVKPIRRLGKSANEIAEGNLTVDAVIIPSKDEIGDLCLSYNRMFYNLKDIILNVRNTNDLVILSSEDIHQSIQENRFAGEEVANATQTISVNLHEQDELIKRSVSTFDVLFHKYNDILVKSQQIKLHSYESLQMANAGNKQMDEFVEQFSGVKNAVQKIYEETELLERLAWDMEESLKLIKLIARETNVLSITVTNEVSKLSDRTEFNVIIDRLKQLTNESQSTVKHSEDKMSVVRDRMASIGQQMNNSLKFLRDGSDKTKQVKSGFDLIRSINSNTQLEVESITQDMQEAFERMDYVRRVIADIEQRSKINKSEVVSIAAMGEEQLATLEEVSESSYELVERIQKMKESIRQFKV